MLTYRGEPSTDGALTKVADGVYEHGNLQTVSFTGVGGTLTYR
ncbi:MAG: hypothetical protein ACLRSW_11405 [Christensenellaceae bacterium]